MTDVAVLLTIANNRARQAERPLRLGLMGGTFDPVHRGHVAIATMARDQLDLDGVLFVPTGVPNFKRDQRIASAYDRLAMCRLAVGDLDRCAVSAMEVARGGVTFSADTLAQIRDQVGPQAQVWFIMGADSLATLPDWNRADQIAALCSVACAARKGDQAEAAADRARRLLPGLRVRLLEGRAPDISSTQVRQGLGAGEDLSWALDGQVAHYIAAHRLYAAPDTTVSTELASNKEDRMGKKKTDKESRGAYDWAGPDYCNYTEDQAATLGRLRDAVCDHLSGRRLEHSLSVAQSARRLAASHGVDPFLAEAAGILHDWDKKLPADQLWAKVDRYGIKIQRNDKVTSVLHGMTAAASLPEQFDLPPEVFQAIARHTLGATDMSDLDIVLYCADMLEPLRGNDGSLERLRSLADGPLMALFSACLRENLLYIAQRGKYICRETVDVWNAYAEYLPDSERV